ncbi:MAG: S-methyl-5'-thioadenosine phosphorylase [bacterium]|nr:S-methyl-5'-thioadenosine phosphorylase [bacterium]
MTPMKLGIIGGTGLAQLPGLEGLHEVCISTPFGAPSAALRVGSIAGRELVFLARHGDQHTLLPSEINYRANIYALKLVGVTHVISVCAVGSLQEHIRPGELVLPDQFFDRTRGRREDTFFGHGLVAHVAFAEPLCPRLRAALAEAARTCNITIHSRGTYVNMEGPAFSTRAESQWYRSIGAAVIGMTNLTEAKLAREAELCYATLAQVTDYDCWHALHDDVTAADILACLRQTTAHTMTLLHAFCAQWQPWNDCPCQHALRAALVTPLSAVPPATLQALHAIIAPYLTDHS